MKGGSNMKRTFRILSVISIIVVASACDKFLDTMPDNRAEINSQSKIQALLTSAYPSTDYMLLTEFMSDNVDDYGSNNPYTDRFIDQVYAWKDITESDNEDSERLWENSYIAISSANQALLAIEELGGVEATGMYPEMAEALLCRAYNHFILVNVFCMQYNSKTSTSDLGIPYITEPETTLDPKYDRGTVAQTYEMIEKDIKAALPYISDTYYTVPKYHFNAKAAYAFAARFYLYYEKFAKSIEYADKVLYFPMYKGDVKVKDGIEVIYEKPVSVSGGMKLEKLVTDQHEYTVDGVFFLRESVSPGQLVPGLEMADGHVAVDRQMVTNIPGCFACGDITGQPYQYIKSAGEGNVAALSAVSYLDALRRKNEA